MSALLDWMSKFLPGMKTQIIAWATAGTGGILLLLDWLNTVDLNTLIPPEYYPTAMMVIGILTSLTRSLAKRNS